MKQWCPLYVFVYSYGIKKIGVLPLYDDHKMFFYFARLLTQFNNESHGRTRCLATKQCSLFMNNTIWYIQNTDTTQKNQWVHPGARITKDYGCVFVRGAISAFFTWMKSLWKTQLTAFRYRKYTYIMSSTIFTRPSLPFTWVHSDCTNVHCFICVTLNHTNFILINFIWPVFPASHIFSLERMNIELDCDNTCCLE